MPRQICKFVADRDADGKLLNKDYYLEWSTIVDAPVTYGMGLEEFKAYYRDEYGRAGMKDLDRRLARVAVTGTSSQEDDSVEDLICGNRAGDDEEELTYRQIVERYCLRIGEKAGEPDK